MEEEAGGGRHCPPPLIGGGGALSLLDESGEKGVYRSPHPKQKSGVAQVGAAGVARPPCRGIPFQYAKIVKNAARCTK